MAQPNWSLKVDRTLQEKVVFLSRDHAVMLSAVSTLKTYVSFHRDLAYNKIQQLPFGIFANLTTLGTLFGILHIHVFDTLFQCPD